MFDKDNLVFHLSCLRLSFAVASILLGTAIPATTTIFVVIEWFFVVVFLISITALIKVKGFKNAVLKILDTIKSESTKEINIVESLRYPATLLALVLAGISHNISPINQTVLMFYTAWMGGMYAGALLFRRKPE